MIEVLLGSRWLVGAVLLYAASTKLTDGGRDATTEALGNYIVLPHGVGRAAATILPWTELLLAVLLMLGVEIVPAAALAAVLLGSFALVMAWHVAHGRRFRCGCGFGSAISWRLAGGDLLLSLFAAAVAVGPSSGLAVCPGWGATTPKGPTGGLLPVPLSVLVGLLAVRLTADAFRTNGSHVTLRSLQREL
jgi:uncharacterized membrane protein YphA (DoxX/SURF4 family)